MQGAVQTTFADTPAVDFARLLRNQLLGDFTVRSQSAASLQAYYIFICNKNVPDLSSYSSKALWKTLCLCKEEMKNKRKE